MLVLSFTAISDVYRSFIKNKIIFTNYCLSQWISKLPGKFEIHWIREYMVNVSGFVGILNPNVYETDPIFAGFEIGKLL